MKGARDRKSRQSACPGRQGIPGFIRIHPTCSGTLPPVESPAPAWALAPVTTA